MEMQRGMRAVIFAGVIAVMTPAAGATGAVVTLGLRNNGETVRIAASDTLVVELPVTAEDGDYWSLAAPPPPPLTLVRDETDEGPQGQTVRQSFEFEASGSGRGELRLSYFKLLRKGFGLSGEYKITVITQ